MKLLVVSHTPHYCSARESEAETPGSKAPAGRIVGFGPTVRELDHLASLFDEVVHLAPLHPPGVEPPGSARAYAASNLRLRPLPPAGGPRLTDKLGILARYPGYLAALLAESWRADAVHVRCPANLSLLAISALAPGWRPWWTKYAGNWRPETGGKREPSTYRWQRFWLRLPWPRLAVTVNGQWPNQPEHIYEFHNPCLETAQWEIARSTSHDKALGAPIRLLFVGNLDSNKGPDRAIRILRDIVRSGVDAELDLVGGGPLRADCASLIRELELEGRCRLQGALPRSDIDQHYRRAHFLLLPSRTEGWPKVVGEAMAWGVVPITSAISSLPRSLESFGAGRAVEGEDPSRFAEAVVSYADDPTTFAAESNRARNSVGPLTYDHYLDSVRRLFAEQWKIDLPQRAPAPDPSIGD